MKLETTSGGETKNPGPDALEAALDELWIDDGFLILSRAAEDYVQAAGCVVEYRQDGRHFCHETTSPERDLVRAVLFSYFADDGKWKNLVEWRDVTDELC